MPKNKLFFSKKWNISKEKVLKVVKPPAIPMLKNNFRLEQLVFDCKNPITNPKNKHPKTFASNVP